MIGIFNSALLFFAEAKLTAGMPEYKLKPARCLYFLLNCGKNKMSRYRKVFINVPGRRHVLHLVTRSVQIIPPRAKSPPGEVFVYHQWFFYS